MYAAHKIVRGALAATACLKRKAMLGQENGDCCVALPAVRLPLYAATHEVRIHTRHGHTNAYALEGTAMVAGVAVPVIVVAAAAAAMAILIG